MQTQLSKWGNSQGIRLPKSILEAVGFGEDELLEIEVIDSKLVIAKANKSLKAAGILSHIAKRELIGCEEGAWAKAALEKHKKFLEERNDID
ncbi:MAG: AbrB/MazE/SpoVT family DNA-binding domain-containing protein [Oscillospiraceae bacterium]|nr:AbrB/MazE/SpoVT family DNA-binding domain-containing protein [Oscillospiraceae bacterium]